MARKLKVYRTAIGFHDAYVAAPSQKAALEAWGSHSNLFGLGMAELVTDEVLTKVALGERGSVWWTDGSTDLNRCLIKNTPYAAWWSTQHD